MSAILLLEDDAMIASGLVYALEMEGYEVFHATKVSDAVEMISNSPDLAILDMQLPDGTGFDVSRPLKEQGMPVIFCDKKWTVEALTNIVKNAVEHSPDDSEIVVDSGENPMYQWISVRDSGMGMSQESCAALFRRFEASTSGNGFGIGVPLALSIIRGQGGDIDIESGGRNGGSTFVIKLFK